ncbi:Probable E3 ubiquitin-protein ligase DTX3 (Protein deltex-3) (Deltex3) (RING finger protein 154) (RING-type E3 ubiquitin transferase DTX3), partial [Durusdinium trenchii]
QALECGSAIFRLRDGSQKCKMEVRFEHRIVPGELNLPRDLDEDTGVELSSVGVFLSPEEQQRVCREAEKECSICSEDFVPEQSMPPTRSTTNKIPSWAACQAMPHFQKVHEVDDDGDVVMEVQAQQAPAPSMPSSAARGSREGPVFRLQCGHVYHTECLKKWFEQRASCPLCLKGFGKVIGNQPRNGSFQWYVDTNMQLPGHMNAKNTIVIQFDFPPGTDDDGRGYPGRREKGYLPCNCQGILQLELFKVAFQRRVMFGLGTSMASGKYKPTFNIHIKTKSRGGATQHGYPDPDYFQRSLDELKSMGISIADLR